MKAAVRDRYGPPSVVRVEDVPRPEPVRDQVLVKVAAASVNRADLDNLYPRWKFLRLFLGIRAPRTNRIGSDVAGVVEAAGPEATRFKPGDRVFGDLFNFGGGSFAEYVAVPEKALAKIRDEISFEDAATLPHSAVLALQGLRLRRGRQVKATDKVMIVGASGNVGPFAVQMAKDRGAIVTGVASGSKLDFVRTLGADEVIDYKLQDPRNTDDKYDWIMDVDAHHSILSWRKALKADGVYVAHGGSGGWFLKTLVQQPLMAIGSKRSMGLMLWWKPFNADDVEELQRLVVGGVIKPQIDRRFSLDEAADALRYVDEGKARGKVLVIP
jgi:NADPH:quinone reductase-like Zn-dependent oxidoreductase